jgi:hypothetical protein
MWDEAVWLIKTRLRLYSNWSVVLRFHMLDFMTMVNNSDTLLNVYLLRSTGVVLINKHCSKYQNSFLARSVFKFTQFKQWYAHPACGVLASGTLLFVLLRGLRNGVLKTLILGGEK